MQVELWGGDNLRWNNLDVDLNFEIINNPEKYPLIQKTIKKQ